MLKLLKNRKGVTLVELLAVIVILGIIAAIAIPTIGGLIERQRENAANASHTNVIEAARLYYTENSGTLSNGDTFTLVVVVSGGFITNPYVDVDGVAIASADVVFVITSNQVQIDGATPDLYINGFQVHDKP